MDAEKKSFTVSWLDNADGTGALPALVSKLKYISEPGNINEKNWDPAAYIPYTRFWAGWGPSEIILRYEVTEKSVRSVYTKTNDPVFLDSCVEFFISDGTDEYFNFEFNAAGTRYAAHGNCRENSVPLEPAAVEKIRVDASLGTDQFEAPGVETLWALTVGIPLHLFSGTSLEYPAGRMFGGNFYKCAEHSPAPHYATWNRVQTATPDFHQPAYFGEIYFEQGVKNA